ncbi:MAG TPA: hypothetical protein VIE16_00860 [Phenylobacterium sp.]|jgi:hypothetical protein
MTSDPCFAYSLSQVEEGWRWTVYDEDGITVADGADTSRDRAEAAVELTLRFPPPQSAAFG